MNRIFIAKKNSIAQRRKQRHPYIRTQTHESCDIGLDLLVDRSTANNQFYACCQIYYTLAR